MRYHVYTEARHPGGPVAAGHSLTIYDDAAGTEESDIYAAASGGGTIANPYVVPATGIVDFWAEHPAVWTLSDGDTVCRPVFASVAVPPAFFDVREFGVVSGTTDSTAVVQSAIDEVGANGQGGTILLPGPRIKVADSLIPRHNVLLQGVGPMSITDPFAGTPQPAVTIVGDGGFKIIDAGATVVASFGLQNLAFSGSKTDSGSIGVYAENALSWAIKDCFFCSFADQGVFLKHGVAGTFTNIWMEGVCMKRADHTEYIGGFQLGDASNWFSDAYLEQVVSTCSFADELGGYDSGYHCGLYLGLTSGYVNSCVGHMSETGFYFPPASSTACMVTACRADLNQGNGFVLDAYANTFVNCEAYRNGRDADATYSGFVVSGQHNIFSACRIDGLDAEVQQLYGFDDTSGGATNIYSANKASALISGGLLHPATISGAECYTLNVFAEKLTTCNDGETNYWGNAIRPPGTTEDWTPVVIPRSGTIKAAYIIWSSDGSVSTEDVSMYLRVDSSSDTLIATVGTDTALKSFNNAELNIPINVGSYFHIKNVFPSWATNPANLYLSGVIYIETS